MDETDTVSENELTYTGVFTFRIYDVRGNFTGTELTGTIAASRVTVNSMSERACQRFDGNRDCLDSGGHVQTCWHSRRRAVGSG